MKNPGNVGPTAHRFSCTAPAVLVIAALTLLATGFVVSPFSRSIAIADELPEKGNAHHYGSPDKRKIVLDALFAKLRETKDGFLALSVIEQIWLTWHQSGRKDVDDLLSRAKINASEGEYEAALKKLDGVIKNAPDFAEGWNGRATVYFHMKRYEKSLADIEETLKREPRHFGALAGRGRIYLEQGNHKAALEAFNDAMRHNPFMSERHSLVPAIRNKLGIQEL